MPKIEKRGNLYRVRVSTGERLPSGQYRYAILTAETESDLKHKLLDFAEDRERAEYEQRTGNITLQKAMLDYIATAKAAKRSPSTIRQYDNYCRMEYGPIRDKRLRQITKRDLQHLIDDWCNDGASPKTVRNKLGFLLSAMRLADVQPPTGLKLPEREDKEMTIPQDEDVQRALFYVRDRDPHLFLAIVLASTLGLRRGEICALTLDDFDMTANTVTISKSRVMDVDHQWIVKAPKSRAGKRTITLTPLVRAAVEQYAQPQGFILPFTPNGLTSRYERLRAKLALPGRFHDLRHYKASVMAALGIPLKYTQEVMGHATLDMLNRVYLHTLEAKRKQVDAIVSDHDAVLLGGGSFDYDQHYDQQNKKTL